MSRRGINRRGGVGLALLLGAAAAAGPGSAWAQEPSSVPLGEPAPSARPAAPTAGAASTVEKATVVLAPEIQVVRLQAPEGVKIEVLGPAPEPIPTADGKASPNVGLKVGVPYRLRVSGLPNQPGVELFPVIEVVGHLHRPAGIDPNRFPLIVGVGDVDLTETVQLGQLVTQVIYLEDPEHAVPMALPKGEIPVVTLGAGEEPLKVASALGRVMAIMRVGGRTPTAEEMAGDSLVDLGRSPCPFAGPTGDRCALPLGPVCGTPPPAGRQWIPRDEYLCDGGDHGEPMHFGGDGGLRGIDPRDAMIRFRDGDRPRVLPTNVVCIYAPRFAAVRTSLGPVEAQRVEILRGIDLLQRQVTTVARQDVRRLVRREGVEIGRHRMRPSAAVGRVFAGEHVELRVLTGLDTEVAAFGNVQVQGPVLVRNRQKAMANRVSTPPLTIKTAESAVVTGIIEGSGEQVQTWKAQETVGVEVPPGKLGLAVLKRVSEGVAEQGDVVSFTIQYRNMGNVPISSVSVIDSLLPRLEYVKASAKGPAGTVFTADENRVGGTELRWDLPKAIEPGAEGSVSFDARVR